MEKYLGAFLLINAHSNLLEGDALLPVSPALLLCFSFTSSCTYTLVTDSKTFDVVIKNRCAANVPTCYREVSIFLHGKEYVLKRSGRKNKAHYYYTQLTRVCFNRWRRARIRDRNEDPANSGSLPGDTRRNDRALRRGHIRRGRGQSQVGREGQHEPTL